MKNTRGAKLTGLAAVLICMPSCAWQGAFATLGTFTRGEYQFSATSIIKDDGYCLYDGFSTWARRGKQEDRLLVVGDQCEILSAQTKPIFVDADIPLTTSDYREIFPMLQSRNEVSFKENGASAMAISLKDEQPTFVTKEAGRYVFWYRRALNPDDGGIGVRVIDRQGVFVIEK